MKKIKLPRKRKKAYIKAYSRSEYHMHRILGEVLSEEDRTLADRFYDMRTPNRSDRGRTSNRYPHNRNIITKRW